ncbi:MAG: glycerol-3-phosphate 1-O-acyltransferase PlsY [Methylococcales bacterium]|jgi:glycerol-3-phosphate acyltransferase PlsY|nr:glycerol-3-phosphate 1-O-acyltransferase PlsY [Methylococcaceae bacterium]HIL39311.1 glycerol-3-phosphate 1-O-acyltransferase [Methylococcales bacterium]
MFEWLVIPVAYLLGSVSSGIIVCKLMGFDDPREHGSQNPGATNVMRVGGKKAAGITLFSDLLKGLLAVWLAKIVSDSNSIVMLSALAVFLGNLFPVFFNFKGGKGVATGCGVLLGLSWGLGFALALTWIAVLKVSKVSSLSALIAGCLAPIFAWFIVAEPEYIFIATVISLLSLWRHKANIMRLVQGTED